MHSFLRKHSCRQVGIKWYFQVNRNMIGFTTGISIILNLSLVLIFLCQTYTSFYFLAEKDREIRKLEEEYFEEKLISRELDIKLRIRNIIDSYRTGLTPNEREHLADVIYSQGIKYGYDPLFLAAIIKTESSFYNGAISTAGARGLMQILLPTGREVARETNVEWEGKKTLHTPHLNITLGTHYLSKLVRRFDDLGLALEAYNRGPARVTRILNKGRSLSHRYSEKVFNNYRQLKNNGKA